MDWSEEGGEDLEEHVLLRCEDLKQEREAVVDCTYDGVGE